MQKIVAEAGGEDVLKASAAERIKKLESIKPRDTLSEMEFRELQDSAGRMFRAGMGAEAIRDVPAGDIAPLPAFIFARPRRAFRGVFSDGRDPRLLLDENGLL